MIPTILITALILTESRGDLNASNPAEQAFGCLQIRPCVVQDCSRISGKKFWLTDRGSRKKSIEMCHIYLEHYGSAKRLGREPTMEDLARIWNGGPDGATKPATEPYWAKVRNWIPFWSWARPIVTLPADQFTAPLNLAAVPCALPPGT